MVSSNLLSVSKEEEEEEGMIFRASVRSRRNMAQLVEIGMLLCNETSDKAVEVFMFPRHTYSVSVKRSKIDEGIFKN